MTSELLMSQGYSILTEVSLDDPDAANCIALADTLIDRGREIATDEMMAEAEDLGAET